MDSEGLVFHFSAGHREDETQCLITSCRFSTARSISSSLQKMPMIRVQDNNTWLAQRAISQLFDDDRIKRYSRAVSWTKKYMAKLAQVYPDREFVQQLAAQIPWGHNVVLLDKISDSAERIWYRVVFNLTWRR